LKCRRGGFLESGYMKIAEKSEIPVGEMKKFVT
jgi:hypothetical protein